VDQAVGGVRHYFYDGEFAAVRCGAAGGVATLVTPALRLPVKLTMHIVAKGSGLTTQSLFCS
jgi:hypothetical protein